MSDVIITTGDDVDFLHQITKDGVNLVIGLSATIKSRIVSKDRVTVYSSEITALSGDTGADWPNGLVALAFSSAITNAMNSSGIIYNRGIGRVSALVETQITDGGKKITCFDSITIVKGSVS